MASKSIGVLTAFINADAAGLMRTFDQVDRRLARASSEFTKPGAKLALGFLGIQNVLTAVTSEIRHVVQNIETIPGVPAETQASIITMRDNLASAKNWIDRMAASAIGFGAQMAQAVGVGMAGLMGYDDASGLSKQESPDEIARAKDPNFDAKIDAARTKLAEMRKASELAGQTQVQQIITLRQEAERYQTFAKSNSLNAVQRLEAEAEAQERLTKAAEKMALMKKQLADSEKAVSGAMTGAYVATLPRADVVAGLENRSNAIFNELGEISSDRNDPTALQKRIDLNRELAEVQKHLGDLYQKNDEASREFAQTVSSGFVDGILAGKSFGDTLKSIALDLAETILRQELLNSLMEMMGKGKKTGGVSLLGTIGSFIAGFFAEGGRPPVGRVSVVGEKGPELFVPDTAGRIIPNSALRAGGGREVSTAGRGGTQYFIDATGADAGKIQQLYEMIKALHGSIEERAVSAVIAARRAGGYRSRAIAG